MKVYFKNYRCFEVNLKSNMINFKLIDTEKQLSYFRNIKNKSKIIQSSP